MASTPSRDAALAFSSTVWTMSSSLLKLAALTMQTVNSFVFGFTHRRIWVSWGLPITSNSLSGISMDSLPPTSLFIRRAASPPSTHTARALAQ